MTVRDDLDRHLTAWLAADAPDREPERLLGTVLARTARTRRRPAWLIPRRWIPMSATTTRVTATPRVPWRLVGVVALLILVLILAAVLVAGSQPRRLPAPFGPARNGLVAYSALGDIYVVDPTTGNSRALVSHPETDLDPVWSRDGTHLAFRRQRPEGDWLYVARADGSNLTPIIPKPLRGISGVNFSPDGREVMFTNLSRLHEISIARADGSALRTLDVGMPVEAATYRPPDGAEIVFIGAPTGNPDAHGVYAVNADGTGLRTLVDPSIFNTTELPKWSPDGSLIAYDAADLTVPDWTVRAHVMSPDGSGDRTLPIPADARWSGIPAWSNDGTRLAIVVGYAPASDQDVAIAIVPVDGSTPGVVTGRSLVSGWPDAIEWAPDDTSVLVLQPSVLDQPAKPLLVDSLTGEVASAPWETVGGSAWQRLAP